MIGTRRSVAFLLLIATLLVLLRHEQTLLVELIGLGALGGLVTGTVRYGKCGLVRGLVAGALVGAVSPIAYAPFWLVFTLPPHLVVDL